MSGRADGGGKKRGASSISRSARSSSRRGRAQAQSAEEVNIEDVKPSSPAGLKTTGLDDVEDGKDKTLVSMEPEDDECK